jgi:outer membrane protein assembly factor BamE (lipoprotein component of BamABCDE complex)
MKTLVDEKMRNTVPCIFIVSIGFDPEGVVSSIDTQTPEQADKVEATNRKIETIGEKPPIIQQLFGNVGRYVKPKNANP